MIQRRPQRACELQRCDLAECEFPPGGPRGRRVTRNNRGHMSPASPSGPASARFCDARGKVMAVAARARAGGAPFFDFRALLETPRTRGTKPGYHFALVPARVPASLRGLRLGRWLSITLATHGCTVKVCKVYITVKVRNPHNAAKYHPISVNAAAPLRRHVRRPSVTRGLARGSWQSQQEPLLWCHT